MIICGFPGIGKSTFCTSDYGLVFRIADSDSSRHKENWPTNYLDMIEANVGKNDIQLVSTHADVREGLRARGLHYTLIYPGYKDRKEYVRRYTERKSPESFIEMMDRNWEKFVRQCLQDQHDLVTNICMMRGEYLTDTIKRLKLVDHLI